MLASCRVLFKEAVTGLGSCEPQKQDPKVLASEGQESSTLFFFPFIFVSAALPKQLRGFEMVRTRFRYPPN